MRIFHPNVRSEYAQRGMEKALAKGIVQQRDIDLVQEYVRELKAQRHISDGRVFKIIYTLVQWRRFLTEPYSTCSYNGILTAIEAMKSGKNVRGKAFKQNTQHDYIRILKPFLLWLIENGYNDLPEKKIRKIRSLPVDYATTSPDELLTKDDVLALINACHTTRDKALISTLYESGCRIGELGRLTWRNLVFDKYGIKMYIDDQKTKKVRFCRLTFSTIYLAAWKNEYPLKAPDGDAPVFLTYQNKPLEYQTVLAMLKRVAERAAGAGWKAKKVHPHVFRKSRITDMIAENYQESIIKEMMWGNPVTMMFKTYVKLSEQMIDNEMLDKAGIIKKEETVTNPLVTRVCGRCHKKNGPEARYCYHCGFELTEQAVADMESFKEFVDGHLEEIYQLFSGFSQK